MYGADAGVQERLAHAIKRADPLPTGAEQDDQRADHQQGQRKGGRWSSPAIDDE